MTDMKRRTVLKIALGGAGLAALPAATAAAAGPKRDPKIVGVGDTSITVEFDDQLHSRVALNGAKLTQFDAGEALLLGEEAIDTFAYREHRTRKTWNSRHGAGVQVTIEGDSKEGVRRP